jgi:hypothetical protein
MVSVLSVLRERGLEGAWRMNKKAKLKMNYWENWVEITSFMLLVLGFFIAGSLGSAVVSYVVVFLCGMAAGRLWYRQKQNIKIPWLLIMIGFLIGFLLGSFYGNKKIIILLFVIGTVVSYYLHNKEIIKTTEY